MPAPLTAEERQRVLETAHPSTPWLRLVMGYLCEDVATGMNTVAAVKTAKEPLEMAHAGGGLAWALDFRERLEREITQARKAAE